MRSRKKVTASGGELMKRKLAQRISDAMVEEAAARREAVVVVCNEVPKES